MAVAKNINGAALKKQDAAIVSHALAAVLRPRHRTYI
jgi:hypothetical protein